MSRYTIRAVGSLVVLLLLAVLWTSGVDAQPCRSFDKEWGPVGGTPVIVDVYMSDHWSRGLHTIGVDEWDAERGLMYALAIWNEDSGANLRLRYAGRTSMANVVGAVVVSGNNFSPVSDAQLATTQLRQGSTYLYDAQIIVWALKPDLTMRTYTLTDDNTTAEPFGFVEILVHELGHALDLKHPESCGIATAGSVMIGDYASNDMGRKLRLWEKQSLQGSNFYQRKNGRLSYRSMSPTSTWGSFLYSTLGAVFRPSSATQNMWTVVLSAVFDLPLQSPDLAPRMYQGSLLDPFAYAYDAPVVTQNTAGTAVNLDMANLEGIMVYATGETVTSSTSKMEYILTNGSAGGVNPTPHCLVEDPSNGSCLGVTHRGGVSAAYDPRSKTFLLAYAGRSKLVVHTIPTASTSVPRATTILNNDSWDVPSIACRDASNGCRIAFADQETKKNCLSWVEAEVDLVTGQIVPGMTRTQCWVQYDTPSIAYDRGADRYRLLFHQQNGAVFAREMTATGTSWTGLPDFWNPATYTSGPVVGTSYMCWFGGVCSGTTAGYVVEW